MPGFTRASQRTRLRRMGSSRVIRSQVSSSNKGAPPRGPRPSGRAPRTRS